MSFLEKLLKKKPDIQKSKNTTKETVVIDPEDNIDIETDFEYYDRKHGMFLFDFYFDLVDEMSEMNYNILDKDYLQNRSYSTDFFEFIYRNTHIKREILEKSDENNASDNE